MESPPGILALVKEGEPRTEVCMSVIRVDAKLAQDGRVEPLLQHLDGNFIDAGKVGALHHTVFGHIAEG